MTTESPELKALLKSLEHPKLKSIDLSLSRMQRHLSAIGNPEQRLPPVVHVAGTNGKGSTIAFLRAICEASGYRCHVFTSPHLVHFKERIVCAGAMLDEAALMAQLSAIKQRTEAYPLTFFEANTVAAFELFAQHPADIVLLEVGMGGRFDATNVIEKPALTIITPVSMDHQMFLGDTLAKIAFEKAGIIKEGVPVLMAPQETEAQQVIREVAKAKGAPLHEVAQRSSLPPLGLLGAHQHCNASVAIDAAEHLEYIGFSEINQTSIQKGLGEAHWPARLQRLREGELVQLAPEGCTIWLDGGHNESAGQVLAEWIQVQQRPVHVIVAMTQQKDARAFLAALAPHAASLQVTQIPDEPLSMDAQTLLQHAQAVFNEAQLRKSAADALKHLPEGSIGLLCGSLYFAGSILEKNR